jgi:glutaredoxin-like YruB-family protein
LKAKSVVVFTTPTCSWCRKVKKFLKENQIRYKEVDVSRDAQALRDMVRKSGQRGVPQVWINNQPVVGYDESKLKNLLEIN